MSRWNSCALTLVFSSFAFAQLDSNSVTVTVSRTPSLQPDQAVFAVSVTADPSAALTDVLNAVQPAGLSVANFANVATVTTYVDNGSGNPQSQVQTQWSFQLLVPLTSIKGTIATLSALQKSVMQNNPTWSVTFGLGGTQVSQQLAQSQPCDQAGLISDARTQAQSLAAAGGRVVGVILGLLTNVPSTIGSSPNLFPVSNFANCVATVKFALLGSN